MSKKFPWYTGDGDDGSTGLLGEGRVRKHHAQPEAFGDVDEASCAIGVARALCDDTGVADALLQARARSASDSQDPFALCGADFHDGH